ncbi:hypothetical protein JOB18_040390 [Solea senegalensis]|uniref:Uncharacterized protein n=1 Tax=Solea senegalensis TaxID=28829 RepID=A0AAV6QJX6_SOLSE|nr:hypothetical protein JOB18_040390 [Solea senegalensis]
MMMMMMDSKLHVTWDETFFPPNFCHCCATLKLRLREFEITRDLGQDPLSFIVLLLESTQCHQLYINSIFEPLEPPPRW